MCGTRYLETCSLTANDYVQHCIARPVSGKRIHALNREGTSPLGMKRLKPDSVATYRHLHRQRAPLDAMRTISCRTHEKNFEKRLKKILRITHPAKFRTSSDLLIRACDGDGSLDVLSRPTPQPCTLTQTEQTQQLTWWYRVCTEEGKVLVHETTERSPARAATE